MSKVDSLINISYIENSIIYTKDGKRKVMFEIEDIRNQDREYVFQHLIDITNTLVEFIYLKTDMHHTDGESNFLELHITHVLEDTMNKPYLAQSLEYINGLRKKQFSLYHIFSIFTLNTYVPDEGSVMSILDMLSIEYMQCDTKRIAWVLHNLFS